MSHIDTEEIIQTLRNEAIQVSKNAYSPYSDAKVGSSVLTSDGNIFVGCNVENCSYGATVCAERNAIFSAVATKGKIKINKIYVYSLHGWTPYGMCLQVLKEFATEDVQIIVGDEIGKEVVYSIHDLFPKAFSASDLSKIKDSK
jgi:cytidine deaminase